MPDQLGYATLNGLLPYLRATVIMHDISNLSYIKKYAMLQESVSTYVSPNDKNSSESNVSLAAANEAFDSLKKNKGRQKLFVV